jgi:hypothetical protein
VSATLPVPQPRRSGRPPICPPELALRVVELRRQGLSYDAISAALNREGVPTPAGRPVWQKSYVNRLLHTRYANEITAVGDTAPAEVP